MIRWLSKEEWKDYIENKARMGKYISHSILHDRKINEAIDKYNFSDAIVRVTINQNLDESNSDQDDLVDIYFDNAGPIKIEGDDYELDEESTEFKFLFYHPYAVSEIVDMRAYIVKMIFFILNSILPHAAVFIQKF